MFIYKFLPKNSNGKVTLENISLVKNNKIWLHTSSIQKSPKFKKMFNRKKKIFKNFKTHNKPLGTKSCPSLILDW